MSLPGTPTADDDDAFFWDGELVFDFLVFRWLISATPQTPILPPHQFKF
jgi:hypothetical protein